MKKIIIRYLSSSSIGGSKTLPISIHHSSLVSELKDTIFEQTKLNPSNQLLTTQVAGTMVTMTNEWPLKYFHVKDESMIYLEAIQEEDKASN